MAVILACTGLSGVLFSHILHSFGWDKLGTRYPVSIVLSYGIFFFLVKVWLGVIFPAHQESGALQSNPIGTNYWWNGYGWGGTPAGSPDPGKFRGGGGQSGGGGASGSWDPNAAQSSVATMAVTSDMGAAPSASANSLSGLGDFKVGDGKDAGALIVLLLGAAVLCALFGSVIYLIFISPQILSEAAFQFAMSAGLIRSAKRAVNGNWEGTVFHETWLPFLVVLVLSTLFGLSAQSFYPSATTVREVWLAAQASSTH